MCNAAPLDSTQHRIFLLFGALLQICDKAWICQMINFDSSIKKNPNTEPTPELIYWAVSKPCHAWADVDLMRGHGGLA